MGKGMNRKYSFIFMTLAGLFIAGMVFGEALEGGEANEAEKDQIQIPYYMKINFKTILGENTNLSEFYGQVILIVNVASKCGYTPQYAGLERLYKKFKDQGFIILDFPANNFGGQEPGNDEEILKFCKTSYDVTFPMMSKISVKDEDKHPLFGFLTEQSDIPGDIRWNFEKFLIDRNGKLVKRFPSRITPMDSSLIDAINGLI